MANIYTSGAARLVVWILSNATIAFALVTGAYAIVATTERNIAMIRRSDWMSFLSLAAGCVVFTLNNLLVWGSCG